MDRDNLSLQIALIHHPVLNKNDEVIGSAVTNLDIHDIARTARTYGVGRYYIATPFADQRALVEELTGHWISGYGAQYNPARREALRRVQVVEDLTEAVEMQAREYAQKPLLIATSALEQKKCVAYADLRRIIGENTPVLLLFGTAHGLAPEILEACDAMLPPIDGGTAYNHLSVRSAAAIIIDRLVGSQV
ncbi:MAG: hypothetical protein CSA20_02885 [Deltaproteobacteria bacterium]|nr:MAG: hypothetical protein CSB23_05165 [Deltaproteobacteria bacterium]PIE73451.1 MAG: hypothetical protein CSA20_02885 [Deltaproteobacteria bacterium]